MPSNPQGPQPFPCGGTNEPACPPQPTDETKLAMKSSDDVARYSYNDMLRHGKRCYDKGVADRAQKEAS